MRISEDILKAGQPEQPEQGDALKVPGTPRGSVSDSIVKPPNTAQQELAVSAKAGAAQSPDQAIVLFTAFQVITCGATREPELICQYVQNLSCFI